MASLTVLQLPLILIFIELSATTYQHGNWSRPVFQAVIFPQHAKLPVEHTFQLTCQLEPMDGILRVKFRWSALHDKNLTNSRMSVITHPFMSTIVLRSIQLTDTGMYVCNATYMTLLEIGHSIVQSYLHVIPHLEPDQHGNWSRPLFQAVMYPQHAKLPVDHTFQLTCKLEIMDGILRMKFRWSALHDKNLTNGRMSFITQPFMSTMVLRSIQLTDTGMYVCNATYMTLSEIGHSIAQSYLHVVPHLEPDIVEVCGTGFFYCGTPSYCIKPHYVCDGLADCPNGSDETIEQCGHNPCNGKIACLDGRCLTRDGCCDPIKDTDCDLAFLPQCCLALLQLKEPVDLLRSNMHSYSADMTFLKSTLFTVIGCAAAFLFITTVMVITICRVHIKHTATLTTIPRLVRDTRNTGGAFLWRHRSCSQPRALLFDGLQGQNGDPVSQNLVVTYNINNGVQFIGSLVEPPPYSEVDPNPPPSLSSPPYESIPSNAGDPSVVECHIVNNPVATMMEPPPPYQASDIEPWLAAPTINFLSRISSPRPNRRIPLTLPPNIEHTKPENLDSSTPLVSSGEGPSQSPTL